jgi:predicted RNase H-like HicB family nuclease
MKIQAAAPLAHLAADVRTSTLERQVALLCNASAQVISLLGHYVSHTDENDENEQPPMSANVLDGGCRASIENTLLNVLSRMDDILTDKARWEAYTAIDQMGFREAEVKMKALEEAEKVVESQNRPSNRLSVSLYQTTDGMWMAIIPTSPDPGALFGLGKSPEEALRDFDVRFGTALSAAQTSPPPTVTVEPEAPGQKQSRKRRKTDENTTGSSGAGNETRPKR